MDKTLDDELEFLQSLKADPDSEPLQFGQRQSAGYLWKLGDVHKEYKLRFFKLEGLSDAAKSNKLAYFRDDTLRKKKGEIDLQLIVAIELDQEEVGSVHTESGLGFGFNLITSKEGGGRLWKLKASTRETREQWCRQLAVLVGVPFVDLGEPSVEAEKKTASRNWRDATMKRQRLYVEARVRGYEMRREDLREGHHVVYEVHVRTNASFLFQEHLEFSVLRRYTDFAELHRKMLPYRELNEPVPYLPARTHRNRFSGAVLEERRQCFDQMIRYWVRDRIQLPLPLLRFLEPADGYFEAETLADAIAVPQAGGEVIDVDSRGVPAVPPVLQHVPGSLYEHRRATLQTWLATRTEGERTRLSSAFAARLVEEVGGLVANQRKEVAELLWEKVVDPHRLFLLVESVPATRATQLVETINEQHGKVVIKAGGT